MDLLAEMSDERAGGKANAVVGIECRSAAHPPRPAQHGDEAVVRMEVRPAEMVALEPLVEHHVKPRLRRVGRPSSIPRRSSTNCPTRSSGIHPAPPARKIRCW